MPRISPVAVVVGIWNACVLALLVSTGISCWPGLHHDAGLYTTPVVNSAARGLWEFECYTPALMSDLGISFNRHGMLYQWVFAKVLHCASYQSVIVWSAGLTAVTFLSTLGLSWRVLSRENAVAAPWFASGIAAMTALFGLWVQGRPEHLIPLLMLLPLMAHEWGVSRPWSRHVGYLALGLVVATSPLPGALCCLGTVAWIALNHRQRLVSEVATCAAISLIAAIAVLLVSCPVSPWQWVINTVTSTNGTPSNLGAFVTPLADELPNWNILVLMSMLFLAIGLCRRGLWWVALILGAGFYAFLWKLQVYVLACFVPAMMLALVSAQARALALPVWLHRAAMVLVAVVSFTGATTLAKQGLNEVMFLRSGISFAQTSKAIAELQQTVASNERIGFMWLARPSFVVFGQPGNGLISVEPEVLKNTPDAMLAAYEARNGVQLRYVVVPQHGYMLPPPPPPAEIGGGRFLLVQDGWDRRPAMLMGVVWGKAMPGYGFALYERRK